jgi:hypothetical protein
MEFIVNKLPINSVSPSREEKKGEKKLLGGGVKLGKITITKKTKRGK